MLLTVTMNPSVDISYQLSELVIDNVNRVQTVSKTAGGKGLNVTRVADDLGYPVTATGLLGGTTGTFITNELAKRSIPARFYEVEGASRNCVSIMHDGKQTEILEAGPTITEEQVNGFTHTFETILEESEVKVVVLSGSLPAGVAADAYINIIKLANNRSIPVVLDTSEKTLAAVLADDTVQIAALKPNQDELSQLLGAPLPEDPSEWKELLSQKPFGAIDWIVVSMGANGAIAKYKDTIYQVQIPQIDVVNPVGSGDATVAGIAIGLLTKAEPDELLKTAMTAGMLNAMEQATGKVDASRFESYQQQVLVKQI